MLEQPDPVTECRADPDSPRARTEAGQLGSYSDSMTGPASTASSPIVTARSASSLVAWDIGGR